MKVFKNASLCILFPLLMLCGGLATTHDTDPILTDEFDILVISTGDPRPPDYPCSPSIEIVKSDMAPKHDAIVVNASVKGDFISTQKMTVGNFESSTYVFFQDLFEGHGGTECDIHYSIEVYWERELIVRKWVSQHQVKIPEQCSCCD